MKLRWTEAREYHGLYKTQAWLKLRRSHLSVNPLCKACLPSKVVPATVVDHIVPHKGDRQLFFDPRNLQSLCDTHHGLKQREERPDSKPRTSIGLDGWPIP